MYVYVCLCCILLSLGLFQKASDTFFFLQVFQTPVCAFLLTTGSHGPSHPPPKKNPEVFVEKMMQSELENSDFFKNRRMEEKLGGGNSNIFYFHPYLGKMNPF